MKNLKVNKQLKNKYRNCKILNHNRLYHKVDQTKNYKRQ
jgi:hypothetical protein